MKPAVPGPPSRRTTWPAAFRIVKITPGLLAVFRLQGVPARVGHVLALALELLLLLAPGRLLGLECILQIIGECRAERGVGGRVEARPLKRLFASGQGRGRDVKQGLLDRQDRGRLRGDCFVR